MAAADAAANAAKGAAAAGGNAIKKTGGWLVSQFTTHLPRTVMIGVACVAGAGILGLVGQGVPATTATWSTVKGGLSAAFEGAKTVGGAAYSKLSAVDWTSVGHSLSEAAAPAAAAA